MSTAEPMVNTVQLPLNGSKKLTQALFGGVSTNGGESHCVGGSNGYTTPVFEGKQAQRALVEFDVASKVRFTRCHVHQHQQCCLVPGLYPP